MTATFEFDPTDNIGRGRLASKQWTLCIGAGINGPLMPTWEALARQLTNRFAGLNLSDIEFSRLYIDSRWPLEGWIQQALNRHISAGGTLPDFVNTLQRELYSLIDHAQQADGLGRGVSDALCSTRRLSKSEWLDVDSFFDRHFARSTVYRIAKLFIDHPNLPLPESLITFNADTLFETICNILRKRQFNVGMSNWTHPPETFSRRVRSSQEIEGHIPIYHLHGCLPPRSLRHPRPIQSAENMIFPENSYTGIAGRVFSWAQTTFLHKAQTSTLCFIGLSMSDPNIRRWLSWVFESYIAELTLSHNVRPSDLSGRHIWVHSRQNLSGDAMATYPFALRHLGIQICWLKNWDQIPSAMMSMLSK